MKISKEAEDSFSVLIKLAHAFFDLLKSCDSELHKVCFTLVLTLSQLVYLTVIFYFVQYLL